MPRVVQHCDFVDLSEVEARFFDNGRHRASLRIPFQDRQSDRTLCVVGQNPSAANELVADRTIRYVEQFVYQRMPEFGQLLILNLYSRVDTKKQERDVQNVDSSRIFIEEIGAHKDFLLIFGQRARQGAYRFADRARELEILLRTKNAWKIDIATSYAPHPGNKTIFYRNLDVGLVHHDFADLFARNG